ncbi:hypothetical protein HYS72_01675 [Candidatus Pacearchaeota archaeon]|nr:hypothetical protein [Candidatus Pacearchaeota archaeon]MBI2057023.1 hypothetical protein [Candidatus Pacearchaeota archaeon]
MKNKKSEINGNEKQEVFQQTLLPTPLGLIKRSLSREVARPSVVELKWNEKREVFQQTRPSVVELKEILVKHGFEKESIQD